MFIRRSNEEGVAAEATEAMKSGQLVLVTLKANQDRQAELVDASGDLTGRWGVAYQDPNRKIFQEGSRLRNASLTSMEVEEIVAGDMIAVLQGRIKGWTNQLVPGHYVAGEQLTVDAVTAKLKHKGASDTRYGQVEMNQRGTTVATGTPNEGVEVILDLPYGL
jgi:hypothetical protein